DEPSAGRPAAEELRGLALQADEALGGRDEASLGRLLANADKMIETALVSQPADEAGTAASRQHSAHYQNLRRAVAHRLADRDLEGAQGTAAKFAEVLRAPGLSRSNALRGRERPGRSSSYTESDIARVHSSWRGDFHEAARRLESDARRGSEALAEAERILGETSALPVTGGSRRASAARQYELLRQGVINLMAGELLDGTGGSDRARAVRDEIVRALTAPARRASGEDPGSPPAVRAPAPEAVAPARAEAPTHRTSGRIFEETPAYLTEKRDRIAYAAASRGLRFQDVRADGDCFFHTLALVTRSDASVQRMRGEFADHLTRQWELERENPGSTLWSDLAIPVLFTSAEEAARHLPPGKAREEAIDTFFGRGLTGELVNSIIATVRTSGRYNNAAGDIFPAVAAHLYGVDIRAMVYAENGISWWNGLAPGDKKIVYMVRDDTTAHWMALLPDADALLRARGQSPATAAEERWATDAGRLRPTEREKAALVWAHRRDDLREVSRESLLQAFAAVAPDAFDHTAVRGSAGVDIDVRRMRELREAAGLAEWTAFEARSPVTARSVLEQIRSTAEDGTSEVTPDEMRKAFWRPSVLGAARTESGTLAQRLIAAVRNADVDEGAPAAQPDDAAGRIPDGTKEQTRPQAADASETGVGTVVSEPGWNGMRSVRLDPEGKSVSALAALLGLELSSESKPGLAATLAGAMNLRDPGSTWDPALVSELLGEQVRLVDAREALDSALARGERLARVAAET
ncbi:OTU domain-containing protein, partial [Streptomyces zhihengii]|uniref:OTU domain-containing protein n=1 Tax=Streptomyces zhihengii TaxID=1818004 RepID=UPI0033BA446B